MQERVQRIIDVLKPAFAGTEVVLVGVNDGIVRVQIFASGCHGGPPAEATLALLQEELMEEIPEIKEVVAD
jgi:Fe-S cluster biogenesis protein NfuA